MDRMSVNPDVRERNKTIQRQRNKEKENSDSLPLKKCRELK